MIAVLYLYYIFIYLYLNNYMNVRTNINNEKVIVIFESNPFKETIRANNCCPITIKNYTKKQIYL